MGKFLFHLVFWPSAWMLVFAVSAWFSLKAFVRYADLIPAPDIQNMSIEEARTKLLKMGLSVVESHQEPNDDVEEGRIVTQTPAPGFNMRAGQNVYVTVSLGIPGGSVPLLTGKVRQEAEDMLRRQRLKVGDVLFVHSDEAGEGIVMAQEPGPETTAFPGAAVHLVVSAGHGTEWLLMPRLTGLSASSALAVLRQAGLKAQMLDRDTSSPEEKSRVLAQTPLGGTRFRRGDAITLTLGR